MAVTLTAAARSAAADAVVDLIDIGATDATGDLVFTPVGASPVLCTCNFTNPAFGNAASGVATAATIAIGTVAGSSNPSTIALALLRNRNNVEVLRCAVATSSSDINLSAVAVNDGDTIQITALTYTQP